MGSFLLEKRTVIGTDALGKEVGKGLTDPTGELLLSNIEAGTVVTVADKDKPSVKYTLTVEAGKVLPANLNYTDVAKTKVRFKVVRKDGITPQDGVEVSWRNMQRLVPTKKAVSGADGTGEILDTLDGSASWNDLYCNVAGKDVVVPIEIKQGMDVVLIKTDAPLESGSIKVICYIQTANSEFELRR